jgi:nuclear protein localization family protein 4
MLIRMRSRDGLERVTVAANATVGDLQKTIAETLNVPISNQLVSRNQALLLSKDPSVNASQFSDMQNPAVTLSSLGITHGAVLFLSYSGERVIAGPPVTPHGAFGKKMTMDDLIARQTRIGEVLVEFIYEPPQQGSEENLILMRDMDEEKRADVIAAGLGLRKVGFIFTQTVSQTKRDYTLSSPEIRQAAELHAESEFEHWATAIVKLEVNEEGGADVHFEAFQLSDQCVKLFKDDWFVENVPDLDPKLTRMKKDVVILGKDTYDVDNDFFLVPVKIFDHEVGDFLPSILPTDHVFDYLSLYGF